jgi:phosphatidylglycerophosphate synthase
MYPLNPDVSLNKHVYDNAELLIGDQCKNLNPNIITLVNMAFAVIIGLLLYYDASVLVIFISASLRIFLDLYDGMVARKCNKTSKVGAKLDLLGDLLFYTIVTLVLYIKTPAADFTFLKAFFVLSYVIIFSLNITELVRGDMSVYKIPIVQFFHDNAIVLQPFLVTLLYFSVKSRK